jgi:hypothetical protein
LGMKNTMRLLMDLCMGIRTENLYTILTLALQVSSACVESRVNLPWI